jgi:tetratricopeptide (TPR) repeat protein
MNLADRRFPRQGVCAVLLLAGFAMQGGCSAFQRDPWPEDERLHEARVDATVEAGEEVTAAMERYQQGDIDGALAAVRRAQKIDPQLSSAHELEALFHADIGDTAQQVVALRGVLAAHPDVPHLQCAAGRMLVRAGSVDEGLAAMQRAVQLAPHVTDHARDLAGAYVDQGNMPAAIAVLTAAQQRNPQDGSLSVALARLHESSGNWEHALVHYTATLQGDPRNASWRRQRARCLYRLEEFEGAVAEFQRCQETSVNSLTFADRIEFGDACLRTGDVERASQIFEELSQSGIGTRELTILRGVCELHRGNRSGAESIFASAARQWPDDPSIALFLNSARRSSDAVLPVSGTRY